MSMTAKRQPRNRESITARQYALVVASRTLWLLFLGWIASVYFYMAVDMLQAWESWGGHLFDYMLTAQSIATGASVAGAAFVATLVRDILKGRGSARVWEALGGSQHIMKYDWGATAFRAISNGRLVSRMWGKIPIYFIWASIPLLILTLFTTLVFVLGWALAVWALGVSTLIPVTLMFVFALMLWRPEPELRGEHSY